MFWVSMADMQETLLSEKASLSNTVRKLYRDVAKVGQQSTIALQFGIIFWAICVFQYLRFVHAPFCGSRIYYQWEPANVLNSEIGTKTVLYLNRDKYQLIKHNLAYASRTNLLVLCVTLARYHFIFHKCVPYCLLSTSLCSWKFSRRHLCSHSRKMKIIL